MADAHGTHRVPDCSWLEDSATHSFDGMAELLQSLHQDIPVFPLDFYHPGLDGPSGAAALFQAARQIAELIRRKRQAADGGSYNFV